VNSSTYRVIYGDTDQMGVVYYANYLALFERGRCEYMRSLAFDYAEFEREGFMLPVSEAYVKYRAPAKFDDLVTIEADITATTRVTATFAYRILRDTTLLAEGTTTHACLTREGRPVRWPPSIRKLFPPALLSAAGLDKTPVGDSTP
jgi:acyl-CoA thioester hydrolase